MYKPALLGLAAILFCVVAQMQARLNVDRKELGLTKINRWRMRRPRWLLRRWPWAAFAG